MHRTTRVLIIVAMAGGLSLFGTGCKNGDKHSDHPSADHPQGEHPQGEHPQGEHPQGEHPEGDHPDG